MIHETLGPCEKRSPIKHDDNLRTGEGDFTTPEKPKFIPADRPKQIRPEDNLRPERTNYRPEKPVFSPAEIPKAVRPEDNLHPNEGQFQRPEKPKFIAAEKPKQVRPKDNLTTGHGEFTKPAKMHPGKLKRKLYHAPDGGRSGIISKQNIVF